MSEEQLDAESSAVLALAGELRSLVGRLRRRLAEEAHPGEFTPSQVSVISHLHREGPATMTTLARADGMRPQSMGAIVAALEAAGFVTGSPDPSDGRQTILSLTDAARRTIEAGRAVKDDWLFRAIRANFDAAEQKQLADGVELLKRLASLRGEESWR
jgi:DNA-binding MarR family transcriptional regulator